MRKWINHNLGIVIAIAWFAFIGALAFYLA